MIRAVLWKEWREQAAIVVALVALGAGVIAAGVTFGGPITDAHPLEFRGYEAAGRLAFVLLALTAGTVIGGTLFAGEAEAGTTGFLETLPASRWRLWRGKVAAGLVLAAAAGGALIAAGAALGALGDGQAAAGWAAWAAVFVLAAFGWGTLGSVLSRSTLAACGIGILLAPVAGFFFLVLANIAFAVFEDRFARLPDHRRVELSLQAVAFLLLTAPLGLSGLIYSAPDRARRDAELTPGAVGTTRLAARRVGRRRSGFGVRALLWLLARQYLVPGLVLAGLALVAGLAMLPDAAPMVLGWPAATLFLGALVGVIGWADEQGRGAARFWGERRLPVGRLWLAKVAAGLGLTLGLAVLVLAPSLIRDAVGDNPRGPFMVSAFRSGLLTGDEGLWGGGGRDLSNFAYYVFLWPVYGFAFGHLAGLLFRKAVVAAGVAVLTGGTFAAAWLPSLLGGGVHHWQLWPVPVLALLTARLLMRPWAADRVGTRRPVAVLVTGITLAVGATAAGLGYRVAEVPATAAADDDVKFAATIPSFEENEAARDIRGALSRYQQAEKEWLGQALPDSPFPDDPEGLYFGRAGRRSVLGQLALVGKYGWPADGAGLAARLDEVFKERWDEALFAAAGKPLGVLEDPTTLTLTAALGLDPVRNEAIQSVPGMAAVLIARGLQKQAEGDPAAYLRYLDAVLALARNARNKTIGDWAVTGRQVEHRALRSLDRWLERLAGRPDLLRRAVELLARHEATVPADPAAAWLAGRVVVRNAVAAPSGWAEKYLTFALNELVRRRSSDPEEVKARAELEANLLGFAWAVPWERERLRRVVGLGNDPNRALEVGELTRGAPGVFAVYTPALGWNEPPAAAARRAAVLRAALRLYQAEVGKPADRLEQLVERKYLPAVPADPFDGKPFRYRLSAGEQIPMEVLSSPAGDLPQVVTGPGWEFGAERENLSQGRFDAVAAATGGLVRYPRPLPEPPGIETPALTEEGFDLVAAVAGGAVQWPLPPLTAEAATAGGAFPVGASFPFIPGGGPAGGEGVIAAGLGPEAVPRGHIWSERRQAPPAAAGGGTERRVADVAPGQGVVWSVGPDETDDGGKVLAAGGARATNLGDLIFIVPPPAGGPPAPPKKKE